MLNPKACISLASTVAISFVVAGWKMAPMAILPGICVAKGMPETAPPSCSTMMNIGIGLVDTRSQLSRTVCSTLSKLDAIRKTPPY